MAISFQCGVCHKPYKAKEQMAGKRVRCKQCGSLVDVPVPADSLDPGLDLGALAGDAGGSSTELEAVGSAAGIDAPETTGAVKEITPTTTRMERAAGTTAMDLAGATPGGTARVRPSRAFTFAYADLLDTWVPHVLVWGGLLWILLQTLGEDGSGAWLGWVRFAVTLVIFWGIVVPISTYGVGQAARSMRFALPPGPLMRVAAIFSAPYVLGYVLWIVGREVPNLITGLFIGLILASFFLWLLLRLELREIAMTAVLSMVGFAISMVTAGILLFGLNWVVLLLLTKYEKTDAFPASPFGWQFAWAAPANSPNGSGPAVAGTGNSGPGGAGSAGRTPVLRPGPMGRNVAAGGDGTATAVNTGPFWGPKSPAAASRAKIAEVTMLDPIGTADEIIRPIAPGSGSVANPWLATVRRGTREDRVTRWALNGSGAPERKGEAVFGHDAAARDSYYLSMQGDQVGHMMTWPELIDVWSFDQGRSRQIRRPSADGTLEMLGLCAGDGVLMRVEKSRNGAPSRCRILVLDGTSGGERRSIELPESFVRWSGNVAVSPDGNWLAALAGDPNGWAQVWVYNLTDSSRDVQLPITGVRCPVSARGMAFSPNSRMVGCLMVNKGNALVVCGSTDRLSPGTFQHIKPGGFFPDEGPPADVPSSALENDAKGSLAQPYHALDFLADGSALLIDGDGIFDVDSGSLRGRLTDGQTRVPGTVKGQWVLDSRRVVLALEAASGQKRIAVVKLLTPAEIREQSKPPVNEPASEPAPVPAP
jgi:hypothetical protein